MAVNPGERIATLESEVRHLASILEATDKRVDERFSEIREENAKIRKSFEDQNSKLDELLELKTMGKGAAAVASFIAGSGILSVVYFIITWFRGDL
jgi:chromosome segregation ATPase